MSPVPLKIKRYNCIFVWEEQIYTLETNCCSSFMLTKVLRKIKEALEQLALERRVAVKKN